MITRKMLQELPAWAGVAGDAEDPGPIKWCVVGSLEVDADPDEMEKHGVRFDEYGEVSTPQREDGAEQPREGVDDLDAALAYLRVGGALLKVPDEGDPSHYHLLLIGRDVRASRTLNVVFEGDAGMHSTVLDFVSANEELSGEEIALVHALDVGASFSGGGGAARRWTVTRVA